MKNGNNLRGMESVIATVSGYHGLERFNLIKLISLSGANYVGPLSKSTTHLVCRKFEGEKYNLAKKLNTIIVNHQWVEECIKQGKRVHEYPFMIQSGQEVGALSLTPENFDKPELVKKNRKPLSEKSNFDKDFEDCEIAAWTSSVLLDENSYPNSRNGNCDRYESKSKRASKRLKQLRLTSTRYSFQDPPLTGSDRSETRDTDSNSSMRSEKKKGKKLSKEESTNISGMHLRSGKRKVSDDIGSSSLPERDHKGKKIERMRNDSDDNFDNVVDLEDSPIRLRNKNFNAGSLSKCMDDEKCTNTYSNRGAIDALMNNDVFNDRAFDDIEETREWNHPPASKASCSSSMDAQTANKGSDECTDLDKSNKRLKDATQHTPGTIPPSTKSANSDLSCVICWTDEFSPTRGVLPCGHRFCYSCIQSWAAVMVSKRKTSTCPLCKASFVSIAKIEDADTSDQKIYSQTIPCGASTSDLFMFSDQERYDLVPESSWSNVCIVCRFREPEDLLISCHLCGARRIHSYCLDPPLFPWTCFHCKDLQMLYHQNY